VIFGIVVNKHAQRFYDEGEDIWPKRYAIWGRWSRSSPDQIAYILFRLVRRSRCSCRRSTRRSERRRIRALAGKLSLDPDALERRRRLQRRGAARAPSTTRSWTIAAPRARAAKSHWARRIETAPFLCLLRCGPASPSRIWRRA
jgi:tricarballylate dehydrogenase